MDSSPQETYRQMLRIRVAEEELAKLYLEKKIMSFVHFYVGQEAVALGVCENLSKEDRALGNHRSHGHYLAKGGDLKAMICELLGKKGGVAHGKGGSMHMIDKSAGFIGSTPILGSVVPLACGSAFEQKYNKKNTVTAVFFGDGAFEEGVVYETLNLAALFKLPLLFVVENNLYSVNSKLKDRRSPAHSTEKIVTGFGVAYRKADGLDYEDVRSKTKELVDNMRRGLGPGLIECMTHRHMAHSAPLMDDAAGYREEDVLEKRLEMDALRRVRQYAEERGMKEEELQKIEAQVKTEVAQAIQSALDAPYPDRKELYTDLYA